MYRLLQVRVHRGRQPVLRRPVPWPGQRQRRVPAVAMPRRTQGPGRTVSSLGVRQNRRDLR